MTGAQGACELGYFAHSLRKLQSVTSPLNAVLFSRD